MYCIPTENACKTLWVQKEANETVDETEENNNAVPLTFNHIMFRSDTCKCCECCEGCFEKCMLLDGLSPTNVECREGRLKTNVS